METVAAACWGGWFVVFLRLPLALLASALFSSQTSALSHEVIPPIPLRSPRRAGRRLLSSLCCGVFFFITSFPPNVPFPLHLPSSFLPHLPPPSFSLLLSLTLSHTLSLPLLLFSSFFLFPLHLHPPRSPSGTRSFLLGPPISFPARCRPTFVHPAFSGVAARHD